MAGWQRCHLKVTNLCHFLPNSLQLVDGAPLSADSVSANVLPHLVHCDQSLQFERHVLLHRVPLMTFQAAFQAAFPCFTWHAGLRGTDHYADSTATNTQSLARPPVAFSRQAAPGMRGGSTPPLGMAYFHPVRGSSRRGIRQLLELLCCSR